MRRLAVVLITCCALTGTIGLALGIVYGQTAEKEKVIPLSEKRWQELLNKHVAEELEKAGLKAAVTDEQVRDPGNWHRAIFNNWEYTVYTGPGQIQTTRWIEPKATKPATGATGAGKTAPGATPPAGKPSGL